MLDASIIETVEESKWIVPMVVQDKKTIGEVCIYVNQINMNDACLDDSFSTPFTHEVLESVMGQEI